MSDLNKNSAFSYPPLIFPAPLYQIVSDHILLDLYRSAYSPGTIIGTEADLCQRFQVSRKTIRRAVGQLEDAGYLQRRQKLGVIVTEKVLPFNTEQKGKHKIILQLPRWNYSTGNWMEREVANYLLKSKAPDLEFFVEIRSFYEALPKSDPNLYAVITADPSQQNFAALESLAAESVRVITIEPQFCLHMAINIYPDVEQAVSEAIGLFYAYGHRRIGFLSHPCEHYTFQLWQSAFISAMQEHNLPILPYAILDNNKLKSTPEENFKKTTAWFCVTQSNVEELFERLSKSNLAVPEQVSVIGSDDPYGDGLLGGEVPISVYNIDIRKLNRLLKRLLQMELSDNNTKGSILYYPMAAIHRGSVKRCVL